MSEEEACICGECDKEVEELCPMCIDICLSCCDFGICPGCGGHLEGDEDETGYCCDCYIKRESDKNTKKTKFIHQYQAKVFQ